MWYRVTRLAVSKGPYILRAALSKSGTACAIDAVQISIDPRRPYAASSGLSLASRLLRTFRPRYTKNLLQLYVFFACLIKYLRALLYSKFKQNVQKSSWMCKILPFCLVAIISLLWIKWNRNMVVSWEVSMLLNILIFCDCKEKF